MEVGQYNAATQADAYYWRGEANYRLEKYKDAGQDLRRYLNSASNKQSQEYGLALYSLGYSDFKLKNYNSALNWFNRFVTEANNDNKQVLADAYNRMGDCNFYARRFDDARRSYDKAEQVDPSLGDYSLYQEGFERFATGLYR